MKFLQPLLQFIFRLGYFGPLVMGILDSSFLVLPFGNDLVVVGMVAHNHGGAPWYVICAAAGSTLGALILALVSRKLGEEGIQKIVGKKRFDSLHKRIGKDAGPAVALAGLAPPPFPFTVVIAGVAAVDYPVWRIMVINFFSRSIRFAILAILAIKFGGTVMRIAKSEPFEWSMAVFIALCAVASGFSLWNWWRNSRRQQEASV